MAKRTPLPTLDTITATLAAHRAAASPEHVTEGRDWYPSTAILCAELASEAFDSTGDSVSLEFAAGVIAAYSMNQGWKGNVTMARRYLCGGGPRGLDTVQAEIAAMEEGADPADAMTALKRPDFYRNITGDMDAVTCDRWHLRAAFGDRKVALTPEVHALVTEATRRVADAYGEQPAETQAIIWCHVRGTGA